MSSQRCLILPVENQVREFDAKLLLACVAAERGVSVYIGSKNIILNKISQLPVGIFLAKELATRKGWMNKILLNLGHKIVAWDEEGIVPHIPKIYYKRRISRESIKPLSAIFAWGGANAKLIREFPDYDGTPIHETGNPRADLLRREVRQYFKDNADQLRSRYGHFILINSSFGRSNFFLANSKNDIGGAGSKERSTDKEWDALHAYRDELFRQFLDMVERIPSDFPDVNIVMRPHPSEKIDIWKEIEARHSNLHVLCEGNAIPWLMAADVLIHNGCTTAIEAALLDRPILAYQPVKSEKYDRHLPNSVSKPAESYQKLISLTQSILENGEDRADMSARKNQLDSALVWDNPKLASDIILDHIDDMFPDLERNGRNLPRKTAGMVAAQLRAMKKRIRSKNPNDVNSPEYQRHVFPTLKTSDVAGRVARFHNLLDRFDGVTVKKVDENIFLVSNNG